MPIMIRILNDIVGRYNFESIGIILDIAAVKMHLQIIFKVKVLKHSPINDDKIFILTRQFTNPIITATHNIVSGGNLIQ